MPIYKNENHPGGKESSIVILLILSYSSHMEAIFFFKHILIYTYLTQPLDYATEHLAAAVLTYPVSVMLEVQKSPMQGSTPA